MEKPPTKMVIIGTAGRKEDREKLHDYQRMVDASIKLIKHLGMDLDTLKLFSGGAAWADHIVVSLALMRIVKPHNVTLYLPAKIGDLSYYGENEWELKTAKTCNYYHDMFSRAVGIRSIGEILELRKKGGNLDDSKLGFKIRNTSVANSVAEDGILLAYTFGNDLVSQPEWSIKGFGADVKADSAGLKDGGTADTWNKAKCRKFHCLMGAK